MIKLENLTKQCMLGQPLKAVDNVNLNVPEGRNVRLYSVPPAAAKPPTQRDDQLPGSAPAKR